MTGPRQQLVEHIEARHGGFGKRGRTGLLRRPARSWTLMQLARWHARQHNQLSPGHRHAGADTGPNDRPPGWRTGADVVEHDG